MNRFVVGNLGLEGPTVYTLHVRAPDGAPMVVHFHGDGEQLADGAWLARHFQEAGSGLLRGGVPGLWARGGGAGPF